MISPSGIASATVAGILLLFSASTARLAAGPQPAVLLPPMGINWYYTGAPVTESNTLGTARQMITNGFLSAGYQYIILDDGWQGTRDAEGNLQANPTNFPSGLSNVVALLHNWGFKFGLYTEPNSRTSANYVGSAGHLIQDAQQFVNWGVDYVKFDLPGVEANLNEFIGGLNQATNARNSIFVTSGIGGAQVWEPWMLNEQSWRRTGDWIAWDAFSLYQSLLHHVDAGSSLPQYVGPGHISDLDIVNADAWVPAAPSMSLMRAKAGMWSLLASPLITDLIVGRVETTPGTLNGTNLQYLLNPELVAIDQDPICLQATVVASSNVVDSAASEGWQIWCKPLGSASGNVKAVGILNRSTNTTFTLALNWAALGLPPGRVASVRDIFCRTNLGLFTNNWTVTVPPMDMALVTVAVPTPTLRLTQGSSGIRSNQFGFSLSGVAGQVVVIECSANFVNWTALTTNTLGTEPLEIADPESSILPYRFYRARVQ